MLDWREQLARPSDWLRKEGEIRDYTEISNSLAEAGIGRFAAFLNYGYVPNGNEQYAVMEPHEVWNRNSVKLCWRQWAGLRYGTGTLSISVAAGEAA